MSNVYRNPDVMWREEDESREQAYAGLEQGDDVAEVGTAVLFSDGMMLAVNVLGTEVWKLCDGRSVDAIVAELLQQFDVSSSRPPFLKVGQQVSQPGDTRPAGSAPAARLASEKLLQIAHHPHNAGFIIQHDRCARAEEKPVFAKRLIF